MFLACVTNALFSGIVSCPWILLQAAFRSFCRLPFVRGHQCGSCGNLLNLRGQARCIFHSHNYKAHLPGLHSNATLNVNVSHLLVSMQDARGNQCDSCGNPLNPTDLISPKCKLTSTTPVLSGTTGPQRKAALYNIVSHSLVSMQDARGDQCDSCGNLLNPTDLINPKCKLTGTTPVLRTTKHIFLDLPKLSPQLQAYITETSNKGGWSNNCVQVMPCPAKCPALAPESCHVLCCLYVCAYPRACVCACVLVCVWLYHSPVPF